MVVDYNTFRIYPISLTGKKANISASDLYYTTRYTVALLDTNPHDSCMTHAVRLTPHDSRSMTHDA